MARWQVWASVTTVLLAVLYHYDLLFITFFVLVNLCVAAVGIYLGASWTLVRGQQYTPPQIPREGGVASLVIQNMMEKRTLKKPEQRKVVISRNLDTAIQEVLDLVNEDFILSWFRDLSKDQETLLTFLQTDMWIFIENLSSRLSTIDTVQFITQDVVDRLHKHFKDIRMATKRNRETDDPPTDFVLHPWLKSEAAEMDFLRQVSEVLLIVLLPKSYARSLPIRHLLREILTGSVLKPTVDLVCDPDYINQKLISYIEYREKLSEDTRRTYTYAATYEDFVKMIEKCEDIEHLKQLRFNIMTEIMQATTINNLKKSQGSTADKQGSPKTKSTAKGELLKARNLKRYINQLTVAKSRCEKRIHSLGGPDYKYYTEEKPDKSKKVNILPGQKVLTFSVIMDSPTAREYLMTYLKRDDKESLLGFWEGVERLQGIDKTQRHDLGTELFQRYISSSTTAVKVDRATMKKMESFMLGNTGPQAFFEAQQQVYKVLESQYYPSFLVSDVYHKFITSLDEEKGDADEFLSKDELFFEPKDSWVESDEEEVMFASQSYHAQQKLQQLDDKIMNKTQALQALKTSRKAEPKMQKVEDDLEKELENLRLERRNLESHILRTQQWCENQGKWKAHVYEPEISSEGEKKTPIFVLVVHLSGGTGSQNLQSSTQGWVVTRKLPDFQAIHEKLVQFVRNWTPSSPINIQHVQIGPWLKKKELPTVNMFTTVDKRFLEDAKEKLNDYLQAIMRDERMAQSEALYGFLTPTPEYFQQPAQERKSKFFLKNLLKSFPTLGAVNRDAEEELLFAGDDGMKEDRTKDSIAEALYRLINEIYELHGMFKWLRKSFISFVEVTFGRSINRQLRETVYWIFSESMVIYYIRTFKDSMWPNGKLAQPLPVRSPEEKLRTRIRAKEKFLQNQPDAVKSLVGEDNARRGTIKMFEVFQDVRLNKHLFYVLLEILLLELCPEMATGIPPAEPSDDLVNIEYNQS